MGFESFMLKRKLKKERNYTSIQNNLSRFRELGFDEYKFLGDEKSCDVCKSLNGKVFPIRDAEVGVNLPPMHLGCRCAITPKTNLDLFEVREDVNPLKDNPKFEEWKKRYQNNNS